MDAIKAFISPPGTRRGAHQQLQEGPAGTGAYAFLIEWKERTEGAGGNRVRRRTARCAVPRAEARVRSLCAGGQAQRTWRGRILAPEIPPSDSAACAYATMCPCLALGENYQRRVACGPRGAGRAARGRTFRRGCEGLRALTRAAA